MTDIKTLYETAKYNKNAFNINAYKNAISEYLESPVDYITNIEYIIQSSIGLNTFKEFMNKYDIPVGVYDYLIENFEKCIKKCEDNKINSTLYKECLNSLNNLKSENIKFLVMHEYYSQNNSRKYLETFYGKNNDIPNNKNVDGMISTFNEQAVPDMILMSKKIGPKSLSLTLDYIKEQSRFKDPLFYEWMTFICKDYHLDDNASFKYFKENSLSPIINKILNNKNRVFKEALLENKNDIVIKYTNEQVNALRDMIWFNEYVLLYINEIYTENANIATEHLRKQNASLYEEVNALEDLSFLDEINESLIFDRHIQHKRTGATPNYLNSIY